MTRKLVDARHRFDRALTAAEIGPNRAKADTGETVRVCRWCGEKLPRRRFSWCSNECADKALVRMGHYRLLVEGRDGGICGDCGLDTDRLDRVLRHACVSLGHDKEWGCGSGMLRGEILRRMGFEPYRSLWEADHIVAVTEGGAELGLDNLRTLCVRCHKIASALLAQRMARKRRGQGSLFSEDGDDGGD